MSQFLINENMKMPAEAVAITGGSILGLLLGGTAECRCTSRLIGSFRPSVRRNAKDFGPARKAKDASGPARVASVNVRRGQSARWVCHRAALGGKRAARELRHGPRRRDHRRAALGGAARQREKCPRARRPIKPGALYAALASADDGSAEDTDTTRSPRRRARHARLGSVPRPHRVRRLLPR